MENKKINLIHGDCIELMPTIPTESVDCLLTDPPYLYLKNQKLDKPFDEIKFFNESKRILKPNGVIMMFGRGTSFYRWNTRLADLGFHFKEEIVWDKSYCTSPLMAISRVHETISIYTNGKGVINRVKVPYLEMKGRDIDGIIADIKRMKVVLKNTKSLDAVLEYLENNVRDTSDSWHPNHLTISSPITKEDRSVSCMRSINDGLNEKTIIRTFDRDTVTKFQVNRGHLRTGNRTVDVVQSMTSGMNEKTIIKQPRDHHGTIHPTQKPVRLLERLLALTTKEGDVVLDPFAGSFSTGEACINTGRKFIGIEIDDEYFAGGENRIAKILSGKKIVN